MAHEPLKLHMTDDFADYDSGGVLCPACELNEIVTRAHADAVRDQLADDALALAAAAAHWVDLDTACDADGGSAYDLALARERVRLLARRVEDLS